jgi:Polyketide cyclase / dehydrase and lipid transport
MGNNAVQRIPVTVVERPARHAPSAQPNSMTAPIRIAVGQHLPVSVRDGFDYITDPVNWREYWPRLVRVDSAARWREPGDRASVVQRILGREVELDMALVRIEPYRLVEYTSKQRGLPAARHWRYFDKAGDELAYRIAVEYRPRPGWRSLFDRFLVRRAVKRTLRETLANLERRLRG